MELILVRHGETAWNREGRVQGSSDIDLSDVGAHHARRLALSLKDHPIRAIYASPLVRARKTAEIINRYHDAPLHLEPGLMEMDQGDFEGLTYTELMARERDFLRSWIADPAFVRMPNGESLAELQARAGAAAAVASTSRQVGVSIGVALAGSITGVAAAGIGPSSAVVTDLEGVPVVSVGPRVDADAMESLAAELTAFWKNVRRSRSEIGEGALDGLVLSCSAGTAVVRAITPSYALLVKAGAGIPVGRLRYEAARAAEQLRPALV